MIRSDSEKVAEMNKIETGKIRVQFHETYSWRNLTVSSTLISFLFIVTICEVFEFCVDVLNLVQRIIKFNRFRSL